MKNAYLYVFSDGQIQIGRPKFSQLVIYDLLVKTGAETPQKQENATL